jgi:hypothetical protein
MKIETDEDHKAALARIDALMSAEAGTPEADELSTLADAVQLYEEVRFPIAPPTAEVIAFPGITTLDMPPEKVLSAAIAHDLETVVIVGKAKDGTPYYAGSTSDMHAVLYMIEVFKRDVVLETETNGKAV